MCDHTPEERGQTLQEIFCEHNQLGLRVCFRDGFAGRSAYNDSFCLGCGANMTLLAQGRFETWEDLDDAGRSLKKEEDRRQRSLAVAQAEQRERMSNTDGGRTFHYTRGTSNKFWTVWREGSDCLVQFGRIGTDGQRRMKPFATIAAANRNIAERVRKKLANGYVEILSDPEDGFIQATERATKAFKEFGDAVGKLGIDAVDRGEAARKAWVTRRKNEAAAKLEAAKPKNPHGLPPGFLGPRRVPKVK